MTVDEILTVLRRKDPLKSVRFDFVYFKPHGLHSYRGDYSQLALGYKSDVDITVDITVEKLITLLDDAIGTRFTGYKGGDYYMYGETEVFVAQSNESGSTRIKDIVDDGGEIVLVTSNVEY